MPTAYEELRERLARRPLPTSLPIDKVIRAMEEQGYTVTLKGSHHTFRKPGAKVETFASHRNRIGPAAGRDLARLFQAWSKSRPGLRGCSEWRTTLRWRTRWRRNTPSPRFLIPMVKGGRSSFRTLLGSSASLKP